MGMASTVYIPTSRDARVVYAGRECALTLVPPCPFHIPFRDCPARFANETNRGRLRLLLPSAHDQALVVDARRHSLTTGVRGVKKCKGSVRSPHKSAPKAQGLEVETCYLVLIV